MARIVLGFALFLFSLSAVAAQPQVRGLDHIPIAVRDLDRAKAEFEALGFVLKPGRTHANGLRNLHAKFADGTELELITASAATDELSRRYVDWLRQGDGPASLGLFAPQSKPAPLEGIFFDRRQQSPTDRPEHFAHPNGARTLAAVWLAGSPAEQQLVELIGGRPVDQPACAPFATAARVLKLAEGEIMLVPAEAQRIAGRPIVAATIAVASLATVRTLLRGHGFETCTGHSLWVETSGLWLEFRAR